MTNATVTVRDAITTAVIAQTNSDANGIADFPALPAGPYTVDATAAEHNQFRGSVSVVPGVTNALEAFMPRQLVTYQWTVVPTEIPDRIPDRPAIGFSNGGAGAQCGRRGAKGHAAWWRPGEASQFTITLSNEGLDPGGERLDHRARRSHLPGHAPGHQCGDHSGAKLGPGPCHRPTAQRSRSRSRARQRQGPPHGRGRLQSELTSTSVCPTSRSEWFMPTSAATTACRSRGPSTLNSFAPPRTLRIAGTASRN